MNEVEDLPRDDLFSWLWRKSDSQLLLSDDDIRSCLGQVFHFFAQHSGRVSDEPPLLQVTSLLIEL